MIRLTLYTTLGCHLCEALEAWMARLATDEVNLERVEISVDDALVERFGARIPVLADARGNELDGGHDPECLAEWLAERGGLNEAAWRDASAPPEKGGSDAVMRSGRRYLGPS